MHEPVEQRRLADVRPSGERDLRQRRLAAASRRRVAIPPRNSSDADDERIVAGRSMRHQCGATRAERPRAKSPCATSASASTSSIVFTGWNVMPAAHLLRQLLERRACSATG